jgi:hypothetical protein
MSNEQQPEKLTERICFACTPSDLALFTAAWPARDLSSTCRDLLRAAASLCLNQRNQKKGKKHEQNPIAPHHD